MNMLVNALTSWQKKCIKVGEKHDIEVTFFHDNDNGKLNAYIDDGTLHVEKPGEQRACFDVGNGQSLSGKQQNDRTKAILTDLRLKRLITDRVLESEVEMDEEECPACGRRF